MAEVIPLRSDHPLPTLASVLFRPDDIVDLRALHKDQVWVKDTSLRGGHNEPKPSIYHVKSSGIPKMLAGLTRDNEAGRNIYFGVNPRHGRSMRDVECFRAFFVDLDHVSVEDALAYLGEIRSAYALPAPSLVVSSGNGVHLYWRTMGIVDAAEWSTYQRRLIKAFAQFADKAIHDPQRVMRAPGFVNHKGGRTAAIVQITEREWLVDDFRELPDLATTRQNDHGNVTDTSSFDRASAYFSHREGIVKGNGQSNMCYKIAAACLCDFGLNESQTRTVVDTWNGKNRPPMDDTEVDHVITKASRGARGTPGTKNRDKPNPPPPTPPSPPAPDAPPPPSPIPPVSTGKIDLSLLADLLENVSLIVGTTTVYHAGLGIRMPYDALSAMHPEEAKSWRSDRGKRHIRAEQLVFAPSGVVADGEINTFQGFTCQPDPRDCPLIREHIRYLCDGRADIIEWVTCWMAHQVQFPGKKLATSIVMHGGQGTGKSMLWECFGKIFSPYSGKINQTQLESDFTQWAAQRVFLLCEEVLAVKQRSRLKNVVKELITGGTISINAKYSIPYDEPCRMNLVFLSNELMPLLLESDDRRFCVIRRDCPADNDYYLTLAQEMDDNGPGRMLTWLRSIDLGEFHSHSKPPHTEAKAELQQVGRHSYEAFVSAWTAEEIDGLPSCAARAGDLYCAYGAWCRMTGTYRCDMPTFGAYVRSVRTIQSWRSKTGVIYSPHGRAEAGLDLIKFEQATKEFISLADRIGPR